MNTEMLQRLFENTVRWEGVIDHLYRDTVGVVTCGVGFYLPTALEAVRSASALKFVDALALTPASLMEIVGEWNRVSAADPGQPASHYLRFCHLRLTHASIADEFKVRAGTVINRLGGAFPNMGSWSDSVVDGVFDMAWQLGVNGITHKFPAFVHCALKNDWAGAARECHVAGGRDDRYRWRQGKLTSDVGPTLASMSTNSVDGGTGTG